LLGGCPTYQALVREQMGAGPPILHIAA
jgi:hypothetical protein